MKEYSPLLKLTGRVLRYYLLSLFGFAVVCVLSAGFGAIEFASLLFALLGNWFLRLAIFNICLMAIAVMVESLRQ